MFNNDSMGTEALTPSDLIQKLEETLERAATGIRDPEEMRKAGEEMDRMREELRQRIGIVDVAVELIRDARSQ